MAEHYSRQDLLAKGMFIPAQWDYVTMAISPSTTETYTFKTGGSGGTTVASVVIVYTDATRADLLTITRTLF